MSAKIKGEANIEESLPDVTLDSNTTKISPDLEAGGSHDGSVKLSSHPNGKASLDGRKDLTLDVGSLDVTGSIGTPSIDPSHSEASFELKTKSNSGSLKKEKKKMKKKKRKEKKDGKKKKDDRLHMSIDLEPGEGFDIAINHYFFFHI